MYKPPLIKRIKCALGLHDWLFYQFEEDGGECRWCGKPAPPSSTQTTKEEREDV